MTIIKPLSEKDSAYLEKLQQNLEQQAAQVLGYPCSQLFDYSALNPFLSLPLNNIGDPYVDGSFRVNTHEAERWVLDHFLSLMHGNREEHWGYVTNGGTEGNMYGLFLAREFLPQAMVYYSEDTHYSVTKILRVLNLRNIMIRSQENGEMDYDDLEETLRIHRDVPPIIVLNVGTTMKGAVDNLDRIKGILSKLCVGRYYIHADAALSGMILPFLDQSPPFDFAAGVDSIAISGHKMIGSPIPCGVVLCKRSNVDLISRSVEYVGTNDATISGSRNGLTPLYLWYAFATKGVEGFKDIVRGCIQLADEAVSQLNDLGIAAWRHSYSTTVVIPGVNERVRADWQLASQGDLSHIIIMPNVNRDYLKRFIDDVKQTQKLAQGD